MIDELDSLVVRVRADTQGFARDVAEIRGQLEGPLAAGAASAGRAMETALERFVRTGKVGFEDFRRLALSVLADVASATLRGAMSGAGPGPGGGLGGVIAAVAGAIGSGGLPGRATGGPVVGGRAYVVGERGPELFVPTASGRVVAGGGARGAVSVTVNVAAPRDASPEFMRRSGTQVARAVRAALARVED